MSQRDNQIANQTFQGTFAIMDSPDGSNGSLAVDYSIYTDRIYANTLGTSTTLYDTTIFAKNSAATSTTTGSVQIQGGLGVTGAIYCSNLTVGGNPVQSYSAGTNISILSGVISVSNAPNFSGVTTISNTTTSTSTTSGALLVAGGIATQDKVVSGMMLLPSIAEPNNTLANSELLYVDSTETLLKSKDSTGAVTTYQPITTKGDLATFSSATDTQTRLPAGDNFKNLYSLAHSDTGLVWGRPEVAYNIEHYGTSVPTIGASFTDIPFDQIREPTNYGGISRLDNTTMFVTHPGTYLVMARVCLTATAVTSAGTYNTRVSDDPLGVGTFSEVPGTNGYVMCNSTANPTDTTCVWYVKTYARGAQIRVQARSIIGVSTVTPRVFGVTLTACQVNLDYNDNSSYLDVYSTSNSSFSLTTTPQSVIFNTSRIVGENYTWSNTSATITLNTAGTYILFYQLSAVNSGAVSTATVVRTRVLLNGVATGPTADCYILNTINEYDSASNTVLLNNVSANSTVQVQAFQTVSVANCFLVANACQCTIVYLSSTSNGQSNVGYAYATAATQTLTTSPANQTYTQVANVGGFTIGANAITVPTNGLYWVFATNTYQTTTNAAASPQLFLLRGFNMINGCYSQCYVAPNATTANTNSTFSHTSLALGAGQTIKSQVFRISTTGALQTTGPGANSILVIKIGLPVNAIYFDKPFGSYCFVDTDLTVSSITSTSFVTKCYLQTPGIPGGTYIISYRCRLTSANSNSVYSFQMTVNNLVIATNRLTKAVQADTFVARDEFPIQLPERSDYYFTFDVASPNGTTLTYDNAFLWLRRIY